MTQPVLETARLRLTPRSLAETADCLAMDREPEMTRFILGPWDDPVAHRAFIEARTRGPWPPGLGYWSLRPRAGGEFLGWVLLIPEDAVGPDIEIGWRLRRAAWGQGFATEAAAALLHHGFRNAGLTEVVADIRQDNHASLGVARKLGFRAAAAAPRIAGDYQRLSLSHAAWLTHTHTTGEPP
jgi:RimJ/RimL family protein N-acetyltransferase